MHEDEAGMIGVARSCMVTEHFLLTATLKLPLAYLVALSWSLHILSHITFLIREQLGVETQVLISQRPEIWLRLVLESAPLWHRTHLRKFLGI